MPTVAFSKALTPEAVLPRPIDNPVLLRDTELSNTLTPFPTTMPVSALVRALHPVTRLPSPTRIPLAPFLETLTFRNWLFTATFASTPSRGQPVTLPLRIVILVWAPSTRIPFDDELAPTME